LHTGLTATAQEGETVFLLASARDVIQIRRFTFGGQEFANVIQFIS
jgi:hypothetical protein